VSLGCAKRTINEGSRMTKCQPMLLLTRTWLVFLFVPSRNIQAGGTTNSLRGVSNGLKKNFAKSSNNEDPTTQQQTRGLVIGGNVAESDRYPYFVHFNDISCGGSLIAPDIVLTAGHVSSLLWRDQGTLH
jgi:hypothetical protein